MGERDQKEDGGPSVAVWAVGTRLVTRPFNVALSLAFEWGLRSFGVASQPHCFLVSPRQRGRTGNVILSVSLVTVNKIIMKTYGFHFV